MPEFTDFDDYPDVPGCPHCGFSAHLAQPVTAEGGVLVLECGSCYRDFNLPTTEGTPDA